MSIQLSEMLFNLYGIKSHPKINSVTSSVDIAVTNILKNNPNRLSFLIVNLGANSVYIAPDNIVSSSHGIYVAPNGGSVILQWDRDFELVAQEWWATAGADDNAILTLENISI